MLERGTSASVQLASCIIALLGLFGGADGVKAAQPKAHADPVRYTGSWWFGPEHNGEGLAIQSVSGDRALVYWFTMTPDGDQAWLYGEARFENNRLVVDEVFRPVGARFGEAFDPEDVHFRPWGRLTIEFEDCGDATLEYTSGVWGRGERSLSRLNEVAGIACSPGKASGASAAKAQSDADTDAASVRSAKSFTENISGAWWDPAHDGEGFVVQMPTASNGNSQRAVVYWFTYDPDGNQAWIAANAQVNGRTLEVSTENAIMASGATFGEDFDADDVSLDNWGKFEIAFGEGEDAAATLSYEAGEEFSRFGSGQQELTRFVPPANLGPVTRAVQYEDKPPIEQAQPMETLGPLGVAPEGQAYTFETPSVADFNQDGLMDVITHFRSGFIRDTEPTPVQILLNEGDGTMTNASAEFFPGGAPKYQGANDFLIEDFNDDGCLDVFASNTGKEFREPFPGDPNGLLLSKSDCTLRDVSETHLPHQVSDFSHGSSAADIDNDGDIDLYVNNFGEESGMISYLMMNDGTGHFDIIAGGQQLHGNDFEPLYFGGAYKTLLLDANGDEYPDLFLAAANVDGHGEPTKNVLLINSGEPPYFTEGNHVIQPTATVCGEVAPAEHLLRGDVNGDGLPDIILFDEAECQTQYIQILINQEGSPEFVDKTDELLPAQTDQSEVVGYELWFRDLDGNGLRDILMYRSSREVGFLPFHYLQDGSGHFHLLPRLGDVPVSPQAVPVDINGDGVLDLVSSQCVETGETEYGSGCTESRFFSVQSK